MITEIKGDLFDTSAPVIVHGCNCQGAFNAGVAKQIRGRYPEAYEFYKATPRYYLGNIIACWTNDKFIINALTQKYYGRDGKLYTDYGAIRTSLQFARYEICNFHNKEIRELMNKSNKIAMPKIGCGLAGGDWRIVKPIIEEELKDFEVEVYYLE